MYDVSADFRKRILSDERRLKVRAAFKYTLSDEGTMLTGEDHIAETEICESVNSGDVITMGSACASELTMKLIAAPSGIDYDRCIIKPEAGLVLEDGTCEYIPLGVFYVSEAESDNSCGDITIKAYDPMVLLDKEYVTAVTSFPVTLEALAQDIASLAGVELKENTDFPDISVDSVPQEATLRDMAGYIAGLMGCFAKFDRDGKLGFSWYEDSGVYVGPDDQYMNEFIRKLDSDTTVTGIVSGYDDVTYSRGTGASGVVISYEDPYMTQAALNEIWKNRLVTLEDAAVTVTYSGEKDAAGSFDAVFDSDGLWETDDETRLFIGDVLEVENADDWEDMPERVKVEEIGDGRITLLDLDGGRLEGIGIGCSAAFTRIVQWICDDAEGFDAEGGDTLVVTDPGNWQGAPERVMLSGMNRAAGELILMDMNGGVLTGMHEGTVSSMAYSRVGGYRMTFMPCELKWRGDPSVEAGDIITADDGEGRVHRIPVMSQTIRLSGGLEMTAVCEGDMDSDSAFSSKSPTSQRISKVYSSLKEAIRSVTGKLTGRTGGFISFRYDENDMPVEMLIMDTDDADTASRVWRWNSEGLGYSASGINGPYETAITSDGEIVGKLIQAGSVGGESIDIDSVVEKYNETGTEMIDATRIKLGTSRLDEAIEASVSSTGGSNLIYNSTGAAGPFDDWEIEDGSSVEYLHEGGFLNELISQRAFRLGSGTARGVLRKTIPVSVGIEHTLSFKIKKGIAPFSVTLDGAVVCSGEEAVDDWRSVVYRVTPAKPELELVIKSEGGGAYIGDIMMCAGVGSTWSQASNEIFGTSVMLTKDRLSIAPAAGETEGVRTVITSTGMDIVSNSRTDDVIASYTNSGTQTKALSSRGQISAGRARLVPIDENNACMLVINE